jgi:hypothetical protein
MHQFSLALSLFTFSLVIGCAREGLDDLNKVSRGDEGFHQELGQDRSSAETSSSDDGNSPGPTLESLAPVLAATEVNVAVELSDDESEYVFTNKSDGSVWYTGYSAESPIYDLQGQTATAESLGEWISLLGWCGTGSNSIELKPNDSIIVKPYTANISPETIFIRVGMKFAVGPGNEGVVVFGPQRSVPHSQDRKHGERL